MMKQVLVDLFDRLNRIGSAYAVLRNFQTLPHDVHNDLDILIDAGRQRDVRQAIVDVLAAHGLLVDKRPMQANGIMIRGAAGTPGATPDAKLRLEVHAQLWIAFETNALQRAVPGVSYKVFLHDLQTMSLTQDGCTFVVPGLVDQFVLSLRQWLFKRKDRYRGTLLELLREPAVADFLGRALERTVTDSDRLFGDPRSPDAQLDLARLVEARWGSLTPRRSLLMHSRSLPLTLDLRRPRPAPVLYMAGPDGCGKTSTATMISAMLSEGEIKHKRFYSMKKNVFRSAMVKAQARMGRGKGVDPKRDQSGAAPKLRLVLMEDITDRDDGSRTWKARKLMTLAISLQDVFVSYLATMVFRLRGYAVIVETSPYDLFLKYHMPQFPMLERVFAPLIPHPSLGLLLVADPAKIHARKRELTPDEISRYYQRLQEVLTEAGVVDRFVTIRTDVDKQATRAELRKLVISALESV